MSKYCVCLLCGYGETIAADKVDNWYCLRCKIHYNYTGGDSNV